jgi:hypothetical protein
MTDSVGNNIFLAISGWLRLANRVARQLAGQNVLVVDFYKAVTPLGHRYSIKKSFVEFVFAPTYRLKYLHI